MIDRVQRFLQLVLLILATPAIASSQTTIERTLDEDKREAQKVAANFLRRMTETRDVTALKDLFVTNYVKRRVELEQASLGPGQPFPLIESIPVSLQSDLTPAVSERDWERFYSARLNLRYLWLLTLASRFNLAEIERSPPASDLDIYPPRVSALLRSNRFLAADHAGEVAGDGRHIISTLEEFSALINTLEQATAIMRVDFLKNPPEETKIYKDNLKARPEGEGSRERTWQPGYQTNDSKLELPKGPRFFDLRTTPAFFELTLVKTDAEIKIVWATVYPYN